ncbi:MAG: hypothetical protein AB7O80_13885 [Acetobacteraceae bacterium]
MLIALIAGSLFVVLLASMPRLVFALIAGPATEAKAALYAMRLFGAGAIPVRLTITFASMLRGVG